MACNWSAENATKAYLKNLQMFQGIKRAKEPDVTEFVSALAGGNSSQLMVEACSGTAGATTLALVAAAHQTGGRVVCILRGLNELESSQEVLGPNVDYVDFVIGDARELLLSYYKEADFVLIDCRLDDHEGLLQAVQAYSKDHGSGAVMVGYNALCKGSWWKNIGFKTQLLPIGEGLLVTRIPTTKNVQGVGVGVGVGVGRKSNWVVRIDKCTGEEHVFRVLRSPQSPSNEIET